jgi:hypothetical protein
VILNGHSGACCWTIDTPGILACLNPGWGIPHYLPPFFRDRHDHAGAGPVQLGDLLSIRFLRRSGIHTMHCGTYVRRCALLHLLGFDSYDWVDMMTKAGKEAFGFKFVAAI